MARRALAMLALGMVIGHPAQAGTLLYEAPVEAEVIVAPVAQAQIGTVAAAKWIVPALLVVGLAVVASGDDSEGPPVMEPPGDEPPPDEFTSKHDRLAELGYDRWQDYPDRDALMDYWHEAGADGDWHDFAR